MRIYFEGTTAGGVHVEVWVVVILERAVETYRDNDLLRIRIGQERIQNSHLFP